MPHVQGQRHGLHRETIVPPDGHNGTDGPRGPRHPLLSSHAIMQLQPLTFSLPASLSLSTAATATTVAAAAAAGPPLPPLPPLWSKSLLYIDIERGSNTTANFVQFMH